MLWKAFTFSAQSIVHRLVNGGGEKENQYGVWCCDCEHFFRALCCSMHLNLGLCI